MLSYGVADVVCEIGHRIFQLKGESSEEFSGVTPVTLAPFEKDACSKASFVGKILCNLTRDCRLAGAGHAIEPEDAIFIVAIAPILNLVKNFNSGTFEAFWFMSILVRIESGGLRARKAFQQLVLNDNLQRQISRGANRLQADLTSMLA